MNAPTAAKPTATKPTAAKPTAAKPTAPKQNDAPATETVKTAESAASEASRNAPLDLSILKTLKPVAVKRPETARGSAGGRTARDNSVIEGFLKDLDATRGDEKYSAEARALSGLDIATFSEIRTRFVQAATKLGIGLSLTVTYYGKDGAEIETATPTKAPENAVKYDIVYVTKMRAKRKPKQVAAPVTTTTVENADKPSEPAPVAA